MSAGIDALAAAVKALPVDKAKAGQVFVIATKDDPLMADAWLGRVAAGDRSLRTLETLARLSPGLGQELRMLNMQPHQLGATFELEYVAFPIDNEQTAQLAFAAALIDARRFDDADAVLGAVPMSPASGFVRAVLAMRTQRWPDVLAALDASPGRAQSPVLKAAAALLEAWAAGGLGLHERAVEAARIAEGSPTADVVRDALFCRALVTRALGDEDTARTLLTDLRVRWPGFDRARIALADPTFALEVTDQATIDTRTDRWDAATATTHAQREAAETASAAKQRLADAEATLAAMVGMDAVKKRIGSIKAETIVRVLRTRKGLPTPPVSRHLLMVGPPGTGKTQSARVIANIFCGLGILPRPDVYETNRDKLAGRHLGEAETQTRELLEGALGATVFFDEFGDLINEGFTTGDPFGRAIIDALVPHMENFRDQTVIIAAGYPMACRRVLDANEGLQSRFSTTIEFESYTPDGLIAIAETLARQGGDRIAPGVTDQVLRAPLQHFYSITEETAAGDLIRGVDKLGNGRFMRTVIEGAQLHRAERLVSEFGLSDLDLTDELAGADIGADVFEALTAADIAEGLSAALPPAWRGHTAGQ